MLKLVMGIGTVFLYGTICLTSGIVKGDEQQARDEQSPSSLISPEATNTFPTGTAARMISEDERERRVQVCERAYEDCRDWCTRTKGGGDCYAECAKKLAACMKDIPYADD
jgi:hypothetical protein